MIEYQFTKDLAANIVFAEVKKFVAEEHANGRTEDEVRTLTRRISWLTDRDIHWAYVDGLIDMVRSYDAGSTENFLTYIGFSIGLLLGTVKARLEVAA